MGFLHRDFATADIDSATGVAENAVATIVVSGVTGGFAALMTDLTAGGTTWLVARKDFGTESAPSVSFAVIECTAVAITGTEYTLTGTVKALTSSNSAHTDFAEGILSNQITAGQLGLLQGKVEFSLVPATNNIPSLGSDAKRFNAAHVSVLHVGGIGVSASGGSGDVILPATGTLATTSQLAMEEPGCLEGVICLIDHDSQPTHLFGGDNGNALAVMKWTAGGESIIVSPRNEHLRTLLEPIIPAESPTPENRDVSVITIGSVEYRLLDPVIEDEPAGGGWARATFEPPITLSLEAFLDYLETVPTTALAPPMKSSLMVEGGILTNTLDVDAGMRRNRIVQPLHNFVATRFPGSDDDETQGYSVGSLWMNTAYGTMFRATSVSDGEALWLPYSTQSQHILNLPNTMLGAVTAQQPFAFQWTNSVPSNSPYNVISINVRLELVGAQSSHIKESALLIPLLANGLPNPTFSIEANIFLVDTTIISGTATLTESGMTILISSYNSGTSLTATLNEAYLYPRFSNTGSLLSE